MTNHILIWKAIRTYFHMTKTYNNMIITHKRVNKLIKHNIHKQITELNQLVNDEVYS